jgi:hypothetical protein
MLAGEHLAVPFHLVGAEQLRAQRGFLFGLGAGGGALAAERAQSAQFEQIECAADVQFQLSFRGFRVTQPALRLHAPSPPCGE